MKQRRGVAPQCCPEQRRGPLPVEAEQRRTHGRFEQRPSLKPPSFPTRSPPFPRTHTAIPIDSFADAALVIERETEDRVRMCDVCDESIDGEPGGTGLFLSVRGDEVRLEEPALCGACAKVIGWSVSLGSRAEEDEG